MLNASRNRSGYRSLLYGLIPLFVVAHFAQHLLSAVLVPLLPMIRSDFALDYTQAGLVVSAFSLSYGIAQLPGGWLTDRIGTRPMITISIVGVALAGLLVGLSHTYIMLIVCLVLMGVLGGGYHPASAVAISAAIEPKKWGQALGLHLIGGSASYFLCPIIAAAIALIWGWRGAYIGLAVPTMLFGVVFHFILGRQAGERAETEVDGSHIEVAATTGRLRRLATVILLTAFGQAVISSVRSFIPLFLVDHFGVSSGTAAISISVIYSAGFWAGPLGGYLSDRWGRARLIVAVSLITGLLIYVLNLVPYGVGYFALLVAFGVGTYVFAPAVQAYIIENTSVRNRSMVIGLYFFGASEVGGVLTPVMGYLIDHMGFYASFTIAGAAMVIVTIICAPFLRGGRD